MHTATAAMHLQTVRVCCADFTPAHPSAVPPVRLCCQHLTCNAERLSSRAEPQPLLPSVPTMQLKKQSACLRCHKEL